MAPKTPFLTVDGVICDADGRILLIRRANQPYRGFYALPGGFVEIGETVEHACRREIEEETGLQLGALELVGVYSDPHRDPRGHTVSIAFKAVLPSAQTLRAGSDARDAGFLYLTADMDLAFDHRAIIQDALALSA